MNCKGTYLALSAVSSSGSGLWIQKTYFVYILNLARPKIDALHSIHWDVNYSFAAYGAFKLIR